MARQTRSLKRNRFGPILRTFRKQLELSQVEVAKRAGVTASYVAILESGARPAPGREKIIALAKAINLKRREDWNCLLEAVGAEKLTQTEFEQNVFFSEGGSEESLAQEIERQALSPAREIWIVAKEIASLAMYDVVKKNLERGLEYIFCLPDRAQFERLSQRLRLDGIDFRNKLECLVSPFFNQQRYLLYVYTRGPQLMVKGRLTLFPSGEAPLFYPMADEDASDRYLFLRSIRETLLKKSRIGDGYPITFERIT
jgi:transcriptional regulator with XRE-family HTH domain